MRVPINVVSLKELYTTPLGKETQYMSFIVGNLKKMLKTTIKDKRKRGLKPDCWP